MPDVIYYSWFGNHGFFNRPQVLNGTKFAIASELNGSVFNDAGYQKKSTETHLSAK